MGNVAEQLGVRERRACTVLGQARPTQRHERGVPDDEAQLTEDIVGLAMKYGRYGYRRVTVLLSAERCAQTTSGRSASGVGRPESAEEAAMRGRLWLNDGSCVRLRPERRDPGWAYDFVSARAHDGRPLKMLTLVDGHTRECLAIDVARKPTSDDVLERLSWLMATRGVPGHIRRDNGPEFTAKPVRSWLSKVGVTTLFIEPASP